MVIIGSEALNINLHYPYRKAVDLDFICTYDEFEKALKDIKAESEVQAVYPENDGKKMIVLAKGGQPREYEIAWPGSTAEGLLNIIKEDRETSTFVGRTVPSLDVLYMLKMSHRYKKDSPHFKKTMDDILFLRGVGAKIRPEWQEWFKAREKETYNYKHPKLKTSKGEFFDKSHGIIYKYNHDDIHESVKHLERPAYIYYKPENEEVMCSKEMFFAVDESVRLFGGVEEAMVLSIERSQVPFPGAWSPKKSFDYALSKICTSITSGFFREFCWENYYKIQSLYSPGYLDKFWDDVDSGIVRLV